MTFIPIIGPTTSLGPMIKEWPGLAYSEPDSRIISAVLNWPETSVRLGAVDQDTLAITYSSPSVFLPWDNPSNIQCVYNASSGSIVLSWTVYYVNTIKAVSGVISDGVVSFGSVVDITDMAVSYCRLSYDKSAGVVLASYAIGGNVYVKPISSVGNVTTVGVEATLSGASNGDIAYSPAIEKSILSYISSSNNLETVFITTAGNDDLSLVSVSFSTQTVISSTQIGAGTRITCDDGDRVIMLTQKNTITTVYSGKVTSGGVVDISSVQWPQAGFAGDAISYDVNCKKFIGVSKYDDHIQAIYFTIGDGSISKSDSVELLDMIYGVSNMLVYCAAIEKMILQFRNNSDGYVYSLAFQITEDAPKNFWTNFHGQSEII